MELWGKKIDKRIEIVLLKFFVKMNIALIPLYLILYFDIGFFYFERITTEISGAILRWFGVLAVVDGVKITVPVENGSFAGFIDRACTGWRSMMLFLGLVIATPIKKKLVSLFFLPLIYVINILRIVVVFLFVHAFGPLHFELVHSILWSWSMVMVVILLWITWIKTFKEK